MAIDAKTLMFMSLAIAVIAGIALIAEGRTIRERAQSIWGLGFLTIALGCGLTPLRNGVSFQIGVWLADGMLIVAHMLFLAGCARFVRRPLHPAAWCILLPWIPLMLMPAGPSRTIAFSVINATLVGMLALASARMLWRHRIAEDWAPGRLAAIFGAHGLFYLSKAALAWVPGGFVDLVSLKGLIIQMSLVEGIPVETLLLLVMAASARRRHEARLISLAESDPLTGLLNRRAFDARAQAMLRDDAARAPSSSPGALMLCDLDHFKRVNDTCGHAAGDQILIAFAALLRSSLPPDAVIARYGGDEFAALLPSIGAEPLARLCERICGDFRTIPISPRARGDIPNTVTIGTAPVSPGIDLVTLLADADSAAYEAKRRGRNQVVNHGESRHPAAIRHRAQTQEEPAARVA